MPVCPVNRRHTRLDTFPVLVNVAIPVDVTEVRAGEFARNPSERLEATLRVALTRGSPLSHPALARRRVLECPLAITLRNAFGYPASPRRGGRGSSALCSSSVLSASSWGGAATI